MIRALVATLAIAASVYVGGARMPPLALIVNPEPGGAPVAGTEPILEYAIRQGGTLLVLIVVLFFYRRDYRALTDYWRDQNKLMLALVEGNTKAQTDTAAALREQSVVVHQAKNVMRQYLPRRRDGEESEGT